jgi:hypothetical protein
MTLTQVVALTIFCDKRACRGSRAISHVEIVDSNFPLGQRTKNDGRKKGSGEQHVIKLFMLRMNMYVGD